MPQRLKSKSEEKLSKKNLILTFEIIVQSLIIHCTISTDLVPYLRVSALVLEYVCHRVFHEINRLAFEKQSIWFCMNVYFIHESHCIESSNETYDLRNTVYQ